MNYSFFVLRVERGKQFQIKSFWKYFGLVLFGLLSIQGCTSQGYNSKTDESKFSVFHGFEKDDLKTWDPANAYDTISLNLVPSVYETLYQYSYLSEVYQVEPLLAEGMPQYSKDRLTLKVTLKRGVRFQDDPCFQDSQGKGRELRAQDFVYGLKRLALPSLESQGWWIIDEKIIGIHEFHEKLLKSKKEDQAKVFEEKVEGIQALDDFTLQFKFLKQDPQFLYALTMAFTAPVAQEAVKAYADEQGNLLDHPVGTGPFKLVRWDRNREIILDRNPNFRKELYPQEGAAVFIQKGLLADAGKPLPFLDRLKIQIIKEAQPRWLNFMKGNIDSIPVPKDNFNQAISEGSQLTPELKAKGIQLSPEPGIIIRYLSFNMKDPLLGKNKFLRQALSSAIDRERWISLFTHGTGKKMVSAVPYGMADRPKTTQIKYDFNQTRAKDLLRKAGYPQGRGLPLIQLDLRGASTSERQLGDFVAQQFSQIGVKTEVILNTFPAFLGKMKRGNLQVSFGGWSMDYPDAENIYQLLYGPNQSPGPGDANYDHPKVNALYEQMRTLKPGKKRARLIQEMDNLIQEDCPWAYGYYEASYDLAHPWLMNFRGTDMINNKFKYFRISREMKKKFLN